METLTKKGQGTARKFIQARALLLCDHTSKEKPWKVVEIAKALGVISRTIEHVKRRFVEEGVEAAVSSPGPTPESSREISSGKSSKKSAMNEATGAGVKHSPIEPRCSGWETELLPNLLVGFFTGLFTP